MTTTTVRSLGESATIAATVQTCMSCGRTNAAGDAVCVNCGAADFASALRVAQPAMPLPPQVRAQTAVSADVSEFAAHTASAETPRVLLDDVVGASDVHLANALVCDACGRANAAGFSFCQTCGENGSFTRRTVLVEPAKRTATVAQILGAVGAAFAKRCVHMEQSPKRSSGLSAASSFLLPGMGQIGAGQAAKGLTILLVTQLLVHNLNWPLMGVAMVVLRILCALDAYRISEKRRRGRTVRDWEWNFRT